MRSVSTLILSFALVSCASSTKKADTSNPASFQPPVHEEYMLPNGLKVLLLQDKKLPYISYTMMLKQGSAGEPASLSGLTQLTASLLEKGTKTKSATVIADKLGDLATDFDGDVNKDSMFFRVSSLSGYQRELLDLFAEILLQPSFPESEFAREKKQLLSQVTKLSDSPSTFADLSFDRYIFENTPYMSPTFGTLKSVSKIQLSDVVKYHRSNFVPQIAVLAVVGKFEPNIKEQIEKKFGGWKNSGFQVPEVKVSSDIKGLNVRIVDKPEIVQTQIRLGHYSISRNNPDYLTLRVANTILGSGFVSRLVNRVRDQLGLTYHISSSIDASKSMGTFEIKTFTQNAKVGEAVRETLKTYEEFYKGGASSQEVADAKSFLIGQFPQAVETPEAWMNNLLILRLYGVPDTYLTRFTENIRAISADDVNRVIKAQMKPNDMKILVFTTAKDVETQLKSYEHVDVKPYTDFQ